MLGLRCLECGTVLVSLHRHDYYGCGCPNGTAVDGGTDYFRCTAKSFKKTEGIEVSPLDAFVSRGLVSTKVLGKKTYVDDGKILITEKNLVGPNIITLDNWAKATTGEKLSPALYQLRRAIIHELVTDRLQSS